MRANEEKWPTEPDALALEAWSQDFLVGALVILACVTFANTRRGILLHKFILIEIICGMPHGTFIFVPAPGYSWYLSSTGILLQVSWCMHNVVAWMKNNPFLSRKVSWLYIDTVVLSFAYWIVECDPWWVFTVVTLLYNIQRRYELSMKDIIRVSPRFAVLLMSMCISLIFTILDILSVTSVIASDLTVGLKQSILEVGYGV
ncbi:hypothetical protein NA57DRAFT_72694 [Rhizodiscina lignyota]|uniref:Uncharacterized protein n=1 Tax=Rhizodiscina lignyota TaxID=1504668 RepID=A0A9P4IMN5_9PEZI|nr:hypothetical protein NA57DRAFT_72694 [Rhizodiscina lignyota]